MLDEDKCAPIRILVDGVTYERFHDCFYIDRPSDKLTKEQVIEVCKQRENDIEWRNANSPNSQVRNLFSEIVNNIKPQSIFEVGPGSYPLFAPKPKRFVYMQGELDKRVVKKNLAGGYKIYQFDEEAKLPIPDDSIDLIIGVFVFQFNIMDNQLREIYRILNCTGGMLVNVYRLTNTDRQNLKDRLSINGLYVNIYPDPMVLCRNHQYWLISKTYPGPLHDLCQNHILSQDKYK